MSLTLSQIVSIASADTDFNMITPSDDIFYANHENERLTDVIATVASAVIGKADLVNGTVPASQLPSYVDDVLEYIALANFPSEGESGKIYVDQTTNKVYRWSGSAYVEISASLALGETSSTAYRGDRGATAYTHSQNGDVHVTAAQKTAWDAKSNFSGSYNDLTDKPTIPSAYTHPSTHPASMITGLADVATSGDYNDLSNRPIIPSAYTHPTYTAKSSGLYKVTVDSTGHVSAATAVTKADITALGIPESDTNTTYSAASTSAAGLMSASDKSKLDGIDSGANNYTLPEAGSDLGGVKTGGDVTISSGTITVNDDSHNHIISNIDNLQSILDGKASSSHTHTAAALVEMASALFCTAYNGNVKSSASTNDVLEHIAALPSGMHTVYSQSSAPNAPTSAEGWRYLVHKTGSTTYGWVLAFGSSGSVYSNYLHGGTWRGWRTIYSATNGALWSGASYLTSTDGTPQVVTPSKKLSECQHGWLLLWSDYDPGSGANDSDFCTTMIPKRTPSGGTWGGKAFYCDIPMYVGSDATDLSTEKRCIKPIYVHDDCIKGSYQNTSGGRNDVALRAVYEF